MALLSVRLSIVISTDVHVADRLRYQLPGARGKGCGSRRRQRRVGRFSRGEVGAGRSQLGRKVSAGSKLMSMLHVQTSSATGSEGYGSRRQRRVGRVLQGLGGCSRKVSAGQEGLTLGQRRRQNRCDVRGSNPQSRAHKTRALTD